MDNVGQVVDSSAGTLASSAVHPAVQPAAESHPVKVPQSIQDIDNGKILGFGPELSDDHPGGHDAEYKARRVAIAQLARSHVIGTPIPR